MSGETKSAGSVFISYAREDRGRVERLVNYLAGQGLTVWWDKDIQVGTSFRTVIQTALAEAACVVVVWTLTSVGKNFVLSEADLAQQRGVLVPVLLDAGAPIPVGFTELQYLDLTGWDGTETAELRAFAARLRSLAARGPGTGGPGPTLQDPWPVPASQSAVAQLRGLTTQIRSLKDLLSAAAAPTGDLRGALDEVGKTYRVVSAAIQRFIRPAIGPGAVDPDPFLELERGTLKTEIQSGRGHCGLILTHYGRHGGLRDWIQGQLPPAELERVDALFSRLGTADGDLFRPLVDIGEVLTAESRLIVNLLLAGQDQAARRRILEGRAKLAPLEADLSAAVQELQLAEASLGYVQPL